MFVEVADRDALDLDRKLDGLQRLAEGVCDAGGRERVVRGLELRPLEQDRHPLIERHEFLVGTVADLRGQLGETHVLFEVAIGDECELGPRGFHERELGLLVLLLLNRGGEAAREVIPEGGLDRGALLRPRFLGLQVEVALVTLQGVLGQFVQLVDDLVEAGAERRPQPLDREAATLLEERFRRNRAFAGPFSHRRKTDHVRGLRTHFVVSLLHGASGN